MVLLKFDINKINTLVSNKSLNKDNITNEEYEFMRNIYNFIIDSEDYESSIKMLAKFKNAKDTKFETTHENGHIYLTCSILDSGIPFFSVKLQLTDEDQAHIIKEKFLEDPAAVYSLLIEHITK